MLVAIQPGVWVVHDYHAQVFFVGDAYWHVSGGVWYRADVYDGGWVAVSTVSVPIRIRHIDERRYVHFEGDADAERKQALPKHAAAKHGGPPGHRDEPGLRLGHDDEPGHSKAAPCHGGGPRHSGKAPDQAKPSKGNGNGNSKGKGPRA